MCLPKSELDSSGADTSWPPLMLLHGGAHLGLLPGFEPEQHIPVKNLKQARQSFPIPVIYLEERAILVCASSFPQEGQKAREAGYVVFGTHDILIFACCSCRAVAGLLMGKFFPPTFSCWQAGLLSLAPFFQRQRN